MGWKALPEIRDRTGDPPGGLGRVGRPSQKSGSLFQKFGIDREALPEVRAGWEALPEVRDGSKGPPGGPGVVSRPFRRSGMGQEALPKVWDGLRGPTTGRDGW